MRIPIGFWQRIVLYCALGVLLAGCTDPPPTPTAMAPETGAATAQPGSLETVTAVAAAPTPTVTPTPVLEQRATATLTPSPTSTPTRTPTRTPMPSATPTPSPIPQTLQGSAPQPDARLDAALRHQVNGSYDLAIAAYQELLAEAPSGTEVEAVPEPLSGELVREASYRLAESHLLAGEHLAAAVSFEQFLAEYPDDVRAAKAALMLARALDAVNECASAIPYYQAYLSREIVLADLVYGWMGDCHAAEGRLEEALAAYRQAVDSASDAGMEVSLREKVAGIYLAQEAYDAALAEYEAILDVAKIDYYRAKIEVLAGRALAAAGQTDAAYRRYQRAVDDYPKAEYAYYALIDLLEAGRPVDEYQRGLVDYYAGSVYADAYGAAIRAFDRYLAAGPADPADPAGLPKADEALYYKALSQHALEQSDAALQTLDQLIADYPESALLAQAWLQRGIILAATGADDKAVKAYQDLAAFFPADERAPQALQRAARLREGKGAFAAAANLYQRLQRDFPGFKDADEALWRAGLNLYRAGDTDGALGIWETLLEKYPKSSYRPKTLYWLGKLGAPAQGSKSHWEQLIAENPGRYYALRALGEPARPEPGGSVAAGRLITAAIEPPSWDAQEAEAEVLAWLASWTGVPTGTSLVSLPPTGKLARQPNLQRGEALLAIGQRRPALDALDQVRAAVWDKPLSLAQLTFYFREQGWHGLAARSALRLAGLWPKGSLYDAPLSLQRLAYPLAYADLISAEAQARNLDPLVLAALIRQESLFEPVAESYAGARGLGQVMPATGEGIARTLGLADFVLDDLYRPAISVKFGAFYLDLQMGRFGEEILIALAAYNGGPGNTLRWLELGGDDLDLFVEVITANQSRHYLQTVYEQYLIYERLYR